MFLTDIYSEAHPGPSLRLKKTVQVETHRVLMKEGAGVNMTMTIVDTPGFGDAVHTSNCWDPVLNYVESQYEAFLEAETQVVRDPNMADSRWAAGNRNWICAFFHICNFLNFAGCTPVSTLWPRPATA
jgi:septin 7